MIKSRLWLLALMVGIPLLGFVVATAVRSHYDDRLSALLEKQSRTAGRVEFTVRERCEAGDRNAAPMCGTDVNLGRLRTVSLVTGLAGLALLALITLAGFAAQRDRERLLTLFRPGLYFTAFAITGLIVAHAIVAIAALYYGESAVVNTVSFRVAGAVGLGAAAGVWAVAAGLFGVMQNAETFTIGTAVSREEAAGLWQLTDHVAQKLGALRPDHIVVGLDPTFFVTEADVHTVNRQLTGRTLFCSLPLARILTVEEFSAIVGHELGHFRGEDTKFSEYFYPIYRGTATAIASLQYAGSGRGIGNVALLPAIAVFDFFLERFAIAERHHSRSRELAADQAGVEATSPRAMASALAKVHAFADTWGGFQQIAAAALQKGARCKNASVLFAEMVAKSAGPSAFEGIADSHTSHPTDSHPTLAVRLAALDIQLSAVVPDALMVTPPESAATLLNSPEVMEEALSVTYQSLIARQLGIDAHLAPANVEAVQSAPA